ncbi:MAG TPA: amidase family protein, partial [Opitutaceae bacterium]
GVFRDLFRKGPAHAEGLALVEKAIAKLKEAGAVIIDPISTGLNLFPLLDETRTNFYEAQFSYDLYFRRLGPNAPIRNMDELLQKGGELVKPNIVRGYKEFRSLQQHPDYLARRDTQETLRAAAIELMDKYRLDALVHPFKTLPPEPHISERSTERDNPFSSITGLPAVLVPAGYTEKENGPIALEFLGRPYSEPVLFRLAYAYEQLGPVRKMPPTTPALPGETFTYQAPNVAAQ